MREGKQSSSAEGGRVSHLLSDKWLSPRSHGVPMNVKGGNMGRRFCDLPVHHATSIVPR